VTRYQRVEETPQGGERLVFRRRGPFEVLHVFAGQTGRYLMQREAAVVAPAQEPADDPAIRAPRVSLLMLALKNSSAAEPAFEV